MNLKHLTSLFFLFGATASFAAPPAPLNNTPESIVSLVKDNYEGFAHNRAEHWLEVITGLSDATEIVKVKAMQKHFNQYPYVDDAVHWGKTDYWASLPELIGVKGGDCEDVAIAKYHSLRLLGVPHDNMRLLVVAQKDKKSSHMVLVNKAAV